MRATRPLWAILAATPLCLLLLAPAHAPDRTAAEPSAPHAMTMRHALDALERSGGAARLPPLPAGLTPEERAQFILDGRAMLGRTPGQWLDWARGTFRGAPSPGPSLPSQATPTPLA